ncbi:MAG TPA: T9SS type A sorting domain-containing protein [Bacteroidia bacterium]|nr:T9SS type A sorting domain-containing protein [Bacteroidia bacterium]
MKKNKQNLVKLMVMAGMLAIQTSANAQCQIKVRLDVTPTNCKGDCSGTATVVDLDQTVPLTYFWSNGETTQSITGLCEGPISVTVWQGGPNCSFDLTNDITVAYEVKVNCTSVVPNAPGTITTDVSGGVEPYSYDWFTNPHQFTSSITNLPAGSYFVIVTDANGCSDYTSCEILPPACNGRTQTMGGWGAPPNGSNPASYLYAKFAGAFPQGAVIGCTNKLKLTTPLAVTNFLPSSGTPAVLASGTSVNPGASIANTLAGQAMALTLTLGFDSYDPNFDPDNNFLGNYIINGGVFNGMTVSQLLAAANKKLGGCATPYTISQLNLALTSVNQNYDNGTVNNGYLNCPAQSKVAMQTGSDLFSYSVSPNPASDNAIVRIVSSNDDQVSVDIYNMVGKKMAQAYNETVHAQEEMKFNINTSDLSNGIYIININTSVKTYQQKLIVSK